MHREIMVLMDGMAEDSSVLYRLGQVAKVREHTPLT